jgi:hypothetical protein
LRIPDQNVVERSGINLDPVQSQARKIVEAIHAHHPKAPRSDPARRTGLELALSVYAGMNSQDDVTRTAYTINPASISTLSDPESMSALSAKWLHFI